MPAGIVEASGNGCVSGLPNALPLPQRGRCATAATAAYKKGPELIREKLNGRG